MAQSTERYVTVLGHGEIEALNPRLTHPDDCGRPLTEESKRKMREFRAKLGNPQFDLILFPRRLKRCIDSAIIFGNDARYIALPLEELSLGGPDDLKTYEGLGLSMLQSLLGDARLKAYAEAHTGECVGMRCATAYQCVIRAIVQHKSRRTLVVTCNPLVAGIGYQAVCGLKDKPWAKHLLARTFGPAEGYTLKLKRTRAFGIRFHC